MATTVRVRQGKKRTVRIVRTRHHRIVSADNVWERQGRQHFLNRGQFETARAADSTNHAVQTVQGNPMTALGLVLAAYFGIRYVTRWMCPPALEVFDWVSAHLKRLAKDLFRRGVRSLWTRPVQQYGAAVTSWVWLFAVTVASTVLLLVSMDRSLVPGVALLWIVLVVSFLVLRRYAARRFRPRPLPARRGRQGR